MRGRKPGSRRGQKQLDESVCRPEPDQSLRTGKKNPPGDHLVSLFSSSGGSSYRYQVLLTITYRKSRLKHRDGAGPLRNLHTELLKVSHGRSSHVTWAKTSTSFSVRMILLCKWRRGASLKTKATVHLHPIHDEEVSQTINQVGAVRFRSST